MVEIDTGFKKLSQHRKHICSRGNIFPEAELWLKERQAFDLSCIFFF